MTDKSTGERLLYTGDFKPRPSPTNEPLEPVSCDILVMEATYGKPEYVFPPEEQTLDTACRILSSWLDRGESPVIHAWRLGKAQELLHLLQGRGFDVAVEESVYRVARAYEEGGVAFPGPLKAFDGRWPEGRVVICPPGKAGREALDGVRGLRVMNLTGWAADNGAHWARYGVTRTCLTATMPTSRNWWTTWEWSGPRRCTRSTGFPSWRRTCAGWGTRRCTWTGRGGRTTAGFR